MSWFATLKPFYKKLLILFAVGLLVYLPSFNNKFVWDDEQFIYKNSFVQSFDIKKIFTTSTTTGAGINSNYYRPFTTLSFAWDYQWWGFNPIGFHLTNTLLHTATGMILFVFLKEIGIKKNISFWLSLLFIIHPIQTEAVVYANSRGDSFYAFFAFISLLSFSLLWRKKSIKFEIYQKKFTLGKKKLALLSVVSYLSAILAKEIGIATLGLLGLTFLLKLFQNLNITKISKIIKNSSTQIIILISHTAVAIGYMILRSSLLNFQNSFNFYSDGSLYSSSLFVRLRTFSKIIWTYFRLLIVPFPLHMERSISIVTSFINPWVLATFILFILIIGVGFWEIKKQKTIWWLFGWGWFFAMLAPVSGIIPINGLLYEHWLYLPMIGFFLMLFVGFDLIKKIFTNKLKQIIKIVKWTIPTVLILLTLRQNYIWGDPIRFYEHTLKHTDSPRLHNNLGMAYADQEMCDKAINQYQQSLEKNNQYPQTYHNLGNCYVKTNNLEKAQQSYEKALKLEPNFFYSYSTLLQIYLKTNQNNKALKIIEKSLEMQPENQQLLQLKKQIKAELNKPNLQNK